MKREEQIFEQVLAQPSPEARERVLLEACGGDGDLRRRVEELLAAHQDAAKLEFFQATGHNRPAAVPSSDVPLLTEKPGDRIGRYKLREKVGEGGCGVVYVAEQEEPVRRRVALKVIKLGMDTRSVVARFEAERQALAMMDHPHIAKVLDAGTTDTGRPFFVMELVRGIRITDYCDQAKLSMTQRLNLFTQVCSAVQHAHQKGIIHRDLKPSNILVTLHDGVPMPKVIDFGIAKATEGRLTDKTVYTELHQFIGTPAYMSPEQAEMSALDIDTRSDIYSLGVLLYELLTGRPPFDAKELMQTGFDEMRRKIREEEPQRPSTRLSTLVSADLTTVASQRQAEAPRLITLLRGDLDWIVMKALEKDRTRRYETANGLAADIQRHLQNQPIAARPPSRLYQLQKLARRNRVAFAAAAIVLVALLTGITFSTWAFVRERSARRQAALEAAKSREVAQFLKDMIGNMKPSIAMGRDTTVLREFAEQTSESLSKGLTTQPEVEIELRVTLGKLFNILGEYRKAEALHRETLPRMRALRSSDPEQLADLLRDFADVLNPRKAREGEVLAREALAISRRLHGEEHDDVTAALHLLADALKMQGKYAEAERLQLQALANSQKLHGPEHSDVASQLFGLALQYSHQGKATNAEPLFAEALAMRRRLTHDAHPSVLEATETFAGFQLAQKKYGDAAELFHQLLSAQRKVLGNDNRMVARTLSRLVTVLAETNPASAVPLAREALALRKRLHGDEHIEVAKSAGDLGFVFDRLGQRTEAEGLYREGLTIARTFVPIDFRLLEMLLKNLGLILEKQNRIAEAEKVDSERVKWARENAATEPERLEECLFDLADTVYRQKKHAEAEPIYREGIQRRRSHKSPQNEDVLKPTASLARLLAEWAWAERTNSVAEAGQSLVTSAVTSSVEHAREAERLLRECLGFQLTPKNGKVTVTAFAGYSSKFEHRTAARRITNTEPWRIADTRSRLGSAVLSVAFTDPSLTAEAREAKLVEAETLLLEAHDSLQQSASAERKYKRHALERLVRLYEAWEKPNHAAEWRAKLDSFQKPSAEQKPASTEEASP